MIDGQMTIYDCIELDWSTHVPLPHEIETFTGRYVDLSNPQTHMICLDDVAHGLAHTCRYNGQIDFYSVAQHAVLCSYYLEYRGYPRDDQIAGLHHDDSEAYLGDVTRPLKSLLQPAYGKLTDAMDAVIAEALKLPAGFSHRAVKEADNWMLMLEARNLLPSKGRHWGGLENAWDLDMEASADDPVIEWEGCWHPLVAAKVFKLRHHELTKED